MTIPDPLELLRKCESNTELFGRLFFPASFKQATPAFHRAIYRAFDFPTKRLIAVKMFRGAAKTTITRINLAKRTTFRQTSTGLIVSETENHAIRTLAWLKYHVDYNEKWTKTFGITRGEKWTENEIQILVNHSGGPTIHTWIAAGITGQIRGLNILDTRVDTLLADDVESLENTATPEQRAKMREIFYGALLRSLVPQTENPNSLAILLGTPLHKDAILERALLDPMWTSLEFGIFDENGESRWPERWTTANLLEEKDSYRRNGDLATWMKEMEVRLTDADSKTFRTEWLRYWDHSMLPEQMQVYMAIDPAPPAAEKLTGSRLARKDDQAIAVIGFHGGNLYLLEYIISKTQTKDDLIADALRLYRKYKPSQVGVEVNNYQRVLAEDLRKAMLEAGIFLPIVEITSKRRKAERIQGELRKRGATGVLFIHPSHLDFATQWSDHPNGHDDLLDAVAMACSLASPDELFSNLSLSLSQNEEISQFRCP